MFMQLIIILIHILYSQLKILSFRIYSCILPHKHRFPISIFKNRYNLEVTFQSSMYLKIKFKNYKKFEAPRYNL